MTKTDLYTKIVLTAIAVFLGIIAFQNISFVSTAQATTELPNPVPMANKEVIDVNIVKVNGYPFYGSSLPIKEK